MNLKYTFVAYYQTKIQYIHYLIDCLSKNCQLHIQIDNRYAIKLYNGNHNEYGIYTDQIAIICEIKIILFDSDGKKQTQ